jgi:hypothetical protein
MWMPRLSIRACGLQWRPSPSDFGRLRDVTDMDSMYERMESVSRLLDWVGLEHRVNYEPMLERLAGEESADSLRVLADASEALGIEGRRDARQYTSLVDLNRFVDAARPESESVRRMERAARKVLATPDGSAREAAELRATLTAWAENDARLQRKGRACGTIEESFNFGIDRATDFGIFAAGKHSAAGLDRRNKWLLAQRDGKTVGGSEFGGRPPGADINPGCSAAASYRRQQVIEIRSVR